MELMFALFGIAAVILSAGLFLFFLALFWLVLDIIRCEPPPDPPGADVTHLPMPDRRIPPQGGSGTGPRTMRG